MNVINEQICCDCAGFDVEWMYKCAKHGTWHCRGCSCTYCDEEDRDYDDDYDFYEEDPPLYRDGRIAGMSNEELIQEARRQCSIHDSAVDRCVEINSPVIEDSAGRLNICSAECKRRGIDWFWPDDSEHETEAGQMNVHAHKQVRLQVWAMVDTGIVEHVNRLNAMPGVLTHTSCEGDTAYAPYIMVTWETDEARVAIVAEYDLTDEGDHWAYAHPRATADGEVK